MQNNRQAHTTQTEWPTLAVLLLCYSLYVVATVLLPDVSQFGAITLLALVIALHSSLQHEVLHGHPFSRQWLNELTVFPAIGLFVPYQRFRDTHLEHHYDPNLTDPYDDPESNFLCGERWEGCRVGTKMLMQFNRTLMGRILIGPALGTVTFWLGDLRLVLQGDRAVARAYVLHILGVGIVIAWSLTFSNLAIWQYMIAAYAGLSILKIRTFLEHRAEETVQARTVIIEDKGLLAFLFLNNNYHSVHHAHPQLPWYQLPAFYAQRRDRFLKSNRNYVYRNYAEIFVKYFLRAKDPVVHPFLRQRGAIKQPRPGKADES